MTDMSMLCGESLRRRNCQRMPDTNKIIVPVAKKKKFLYNYDVIVCKTDKHRLQEVETWLSQ